MLVKANNGATLGSPRSRVQGPGSPFLANQKLFSGIIDPTGRGRAIPPFGSRALEGAVSQ